MVTKLVPRKIVAMVMGAWFLSSAMAHHLAGGIAELTTQKDEKNPIEIVCNDLIISLENRDMIKDKKNIELLKEDIYNSVNNGLKVIYLSGKDIKLNNASPDRFDLYSASDSCLSSMKHLRMDTLITETVVFDAHIKNILIPAFYKGAEVIIKNAEKTADDAENKKYIDKESINNYSISSLVSLGGLINYNKVFEMIGIIAASASVLLLILVPWLRKKMHGIH